MADDEVTESTFQGYIASTHDALLVFEAVRRGMMPKIPRRLKDDERKLLRSGNIFVFDEKQSNIKRWTDGMLWSPSRILSNFLIYRQVHRKTSKAELSQDGDTHSAPVSATGLSAGAPSMVDAQQELPRRASEGLLRDNDQGSPMLLDAMSRTRSGSLVSEQEQSWPIYAKGQSSSAFASASATAAGLVSAASHSSDMQETSPTGETWSKSALSSLDGPRDMDPDGDLDRSLVGSLTSTYLFVKGGLCKKTISLTVDNSTHHLISYYSVEDVRAGRLRTPSSLPEIRSLAISPVFLDPKNFRDPPNIEIGHDGLPRYRGDANDGRSSRSGTNSGGDSAASGSDTRNPRSALGRAAAELPFSTSGPYSPTYQTDASSHASSPASAMIRAAHTSGSTGSVEQPVAGPSVPRRLSDAPLRARATSTTSRFEPYPVTWAANPQRISRPGTPNRSSFESMSGSSRASDRTGATSPSAAPAVPPSLGSHLSSWPAPSSTRGHAMSESGVPLYTSFDSGLVYESSEFAGEPIPIASSAASSPRDHLNAQWAGNYGQSHHGHHGLVHSLSNDNFSSSAGWQMPSSGGQFTSPVHSTYVQSQLPQLHGARHASHWQQADKLGHAVAPVRPGTSTSQSFPYAMERPATAHPTFDTPSSSSSRTSLSSDGHLRRSHSSHQQEGSSYSSWTELGAGAGHDGANQPDHVDAIITDPTPAAADNIQLQSGSSGLASSASKHHLEQSAFSSSAARNTFDHNFSILASSVQFPPTSSQFPLAAIPVTHVPSPCRKSAFSNNVSQGSRPTAITSSMFALASARPCPSASDPYRQVAVFIGRSHTVLRPAS